MKLRELMVLGLALMIPSVGMSAEPEHPIGVKIKLGAAMPQFDSPRTRFADGVGINYRVAPHYDLGMFVESASKSSSANDLGISSEAKELFLGIEGNYWFQEGGAGPHLGAKLGWAREKSDLSGPFISPSSEVTNDLFVGVSAGYQLALWKNVTTGPELNVFGITQSAIAFYPETLWVVRSSF